MQVVAISKPRHSHEEKLLHAQFELRARVFSGRLSWDVEVKDGIEKDRFDALNPTYILAVQTDGLVTGCVRLLPAVGPTMVNDVFGALLAHGRLCSHVAMIESSRFCVDTASDQGRGDRSIHETTLAMSAGIVEWCVVHGFTEIVTVTDLRFERILSRVGWPLNRLGPSVRIGSTAAVAGTLPADRDVLLRLMPSNYRSQITLPSQRAA